ncbi:acyl-CoA thioesterase [Nonomuraea sp. K274]|uniref:Acyl-CoA thioesterase n=1 Tax=Nonomuraea cypriaca TaxID=1187855 RepID=A0A931A344_9ACTN|nr:acyl-CoA thioesterase [Nonomuraea cypriaca]MBF8185366.1 acyl-CoA thioesterase [Nonomuraea cypriaca]
MTFSTRITVRGYEIDMLGHVNNTVYFQYGEHARWECLRAAGVSPDDLMKQETAPVVLETTIRYHRELRLGDEVEVTCAFEYGEGKTFAYRQELRRADGKLAAEMTGVAGIMDLRARRLLDDPRARWRELASDPGPLGL